jgi:hypothetical protein
MMCFIVTILPFKDYLALKGVKNTVYRYPLQISGYRGIGLISILM